MTGRLDPENRKRPAAAPWFLGALLLLASCDTPASADDPPSAYRRFYNAAAAGDWDGMLQMLEPKGRACLQQAAERLYGAAGTPEDALAAYLHQARAELVTPLRELKILEQENDRAWLQVRAGPCDRPETCQTSRVAMLRGPQGWRVQLRFPEPLLREQGVEPCEM